MQPPMFSGRATTQLRPVVLACCAGLLLGCVPGGAQARTLEVGPGKEFKLPSEAIQRASNGDVVRIAPGEYYDCAVIRQDNLTIEGTGPDASAVLTDKTCGGKGILVVNGDNVTVRNLTLARARVPDENGAGIRAQGGDLTVDGVKFINNQDGILGGSKRDSKMIIRNSLFKDNGFCGQLCSHAIYTGPLGLLRVENSRFVGTRQGHHIKSRALRTEVVNSTIQDGPEGTSSYLIETPNGGALLVEGNTLEKGPNAENKTAAIVIGAEGVDRPSPEIIIRNNRFRNDGSSSTVFVRNGTATEAKLSGNTLSGPVKPLQGDGRVMN